MQTKAAECGLACLAMVAFHGHRIDLNTLRRRRPVPLNGEMLRGLIQVASQVHLASGPLRFELEGLRQLRLPVIVRWGVKHSMMLKAVMGAGVVIHGSAEGIRFCPLAAASTSPASASPTGQG